MQMNCKHTLLHYNRTSTQENLLLRDKCGLADRQQKWFSKMKLYLEFT